MIGYFNLQVLRGLSTNRSLLSCQATGLVDLWNQDDFSGRQRWVTTQVQGQPANVFTFTVYGGTNQGKTYLSVAGDNQTVDLEAADDGSGRQRWALIPVDSVSVGIEIPSYYLLAPQSRQGLYLSCTADGTRVDLWDDDGSGRQRWQMQGPGYDEGTVGG